MRTYLVPRGVHNSFLFSFGCLTFLASTLEVTEKKAKNRQKTEKCKPSVPIRNSLQIL